jgi:hypothetical protein
MGDREHVHALAKRSNFALSSGNIPVLATVRYPLLFYRPSVAVLIAMSHHTAVVMYCSVHLFYCMGDPSKIPALATS